MLVGCIDECLILGWADMLVTDPTTANLIAAAVMSRPSVTHRCSIKMANTYTSPLTANCRYEIRMSDP